MTLDFEEISAQHVMVQLEFGYFVGIQNGHGNDQSAKPISGMEFLQRSRPGGPEASALLVGAHSVMVPGWCRVPSTSLDIHNLTLLHLGSIMSQSAYTKLS